MTSGQLFEIPITSSSSPSKGINKIVCGSPAPQVYLLTFTAPPDNRLITPFCQAFLLALDIIEFSYPPGVVITTSGIAKFYSNGLDLEHAVNTEGYWRNSLYKLFKRLVTYPMPTIALINGHAFAGGLMLAMYHDYRIFNPSRGFLCLNELDFGYPLKPAMSVIFRQKIPYPAVYRSLVLEAKRFGSKDALEGGIVDGLGALQEALDLVRERKLTEKGKTSIYGLMKAEMYRDTVDLLDGHDREEKRDRNLIEEDEARKKVGQLLVREWEGRSKHINSSKL